MNIAEIVSKIRQEAPVLIGLKFNNVVGITRTEGGFKVNVEMVEKESIPDGMDILGLYEVNLDTDGQVMSFSRKALRKRNDTAITKAEDLS